ncbi:MAG: LuxR C-terminal-related transcriptional regulator [Anaerolineales bacterium]|nr:LuxR C-terminal-related transcriptional regulator [Anaerolineales bacterium]
MDVHYLNEVDEYSIGEDAAARGIEVEYVSQLISAFGASSSPVTIERPPSAGTRQPDPGAGLVEPLSERELQVLRLLDSPLTSEDIGRELFVSANTVRTHIRNIYGKLGVHGRLEAIQRARELKLL